MSASNVFVPCWYYIDVGGKLAEDKKLNWRCRRIWCSSEEDIHTAVERMMNGAGEVLAFESTLPGRIPRAIDMEREAHLAFPSLDKPLCE